MARQPADHAAAGLPSYRPVAVRFERLEVEQQRARLLEFQRRMTTRRSVRHYSREAVPDDLIDAAIAVAASAPSGANMQPWRFVVVRDQAVRQQIRKAAEDEEWAFYDRRAPDDWLSALAPLGTDWRKPFLEDAPCLIVVFKIEYGLEIAADGTERHIKHYYATESVGIACGFLIAALHMAGLATLTHTPSPMGFLTSILQRPKNENPFLLIPVGVPAADAVVPVIARKSLDEVRIVV